MNRIERLYALTTALQTKKIVKAEELARKFNVSLRTIYRDIRALEAGGMPIGAEAGIGYFLTDGYHLPPVMFTKEEGRALLMAEKIIQKITDPSVSNAYGSALSKVRAVLDSEKKEELQGLEEKIMVNPFPFTPPEPTNQVLETLKEAIVQNKVIEVDYYANYNGLHSKRRIESMGLVYYSNHWHLIGYCQMRKDYRDFRSDRMGNVRIINERFKSFNHPSLKEYVDNLSNRTDLRQIKIRLKEYILKYIADSKYGMGFIGSEIDEENEGYVILTFATDGLDYFARWLLMMVDSAEVLEPLELKEKVKNFVLALNGHYNKE